MKNKNRIIFFLVENQYLKTKNILINLIFGWSPFDKPACLSDGLKMTTEENLYVMSKNYDSRFTKQVIKKLLPIEQG